MRKLREDNDADLDLPKAHSQHAARTEELQLVSARMYIVSSTRRFFVRENMSEIHYFEKTVVVDFVGGNAVTITSEDENFTQTKSQGNEPRQGLKCR